MWNVLVDHLLVESEQNSKVNVDGFVVDVRSQVHHHEKVVEKRRPFRRVVGQEGQNEKLWEFVDDEASPLRIDILKDDVVWNVTSKCC